MNLSISTQLITVRKTLQIRISKEIWKKNTQVFSMSRHKALKLILTASAVKIQILESLILAQDERWRRA